MTSWEWLSNKFPSQIRRQLLAGGGTRRSLLNRIAFPALRVFSGILLASAAIGAASEKPADKVYDLPGLLNLAQAALSSSQENFDASNAFFEDGLATITELVSAQNELAAARSERIRATADYLTGIASLTLAIGKPVTTASKESSSSEYPPAAMGRRDARAVPRAK
jgi:hypothetical protein